MNKQNMNGKSKKQPGIGRRLLSFLLAVSFVISGLGVTGCRISEKGMLEHPQVSDSRSQEQTQKDFEAFLQEMFVQEITDDSITLNYTIKDPAAYGIDTEELEPSLGEYSMSALQNSLIVSENWLASLETFDYDKLTQEQQLIYDILNQQLNQNLEASGLIEYSECLGPTTGIQAQLPILLAEYNFYTEKDVETYLSILKLVPAYFQQILDFEKEKSSKGLFMSDTTAQAIIDQCQDFIASPEENYLISVFDQRLEDMDISKEKKEEYQKKNREAVLDSLVPAYQTLIDGLSELKGSGTNQGGLCHFEKGKEYYTYLLRAMTGSDRSPEDIDQLLEKTLRAAQKKMGQIMSQSPSAYYDAQDVKYPYSEPTEAIKWLQQQMLADFPPLSEDITCQIKYVDESLEESLSPAFYLTSPIDNYKNNVVYINQNKEYDLSQSFPTIGHESYPGHLYQNCYFQSTKPHPIRSIIDIGGYSEGWGTYAELYSYHLADLEEEVADLLEQNALATLCLYARADLLVNYRGWSYQKLENYLEEFGFSASQSKIVFDSMVAEPVGYMKYTLGYLEIRQLRDTAEDGLGKKFSPKAFHEFFLSIGTAPFSVIRNRMETWMQEQREKETE